MPILVKSTYWNRKRPLALSGPLGFKLFCAALCVQRYLGAAKTVRKQRANRCLDFLPYFKQNSSELFI